MNTPMNCDLEFEKFSTTKTQVISHNKKSFQFKTHTGVYNSINLLYFGLV